MKSSLRILIPLFAILGGLALYKWINTPKTVSNPAPTPPSSQQGFICSALSQATTIEFTGELLPVQSLSIIPELSGKIQSVFVQEGAAVQTNQILIQLDDQEWLAAKNKAEANYQMANSKAERLKPLVSSGSISQLDYDEAFYSAQQRKAEFDLASLHLSRCKIKAPFNGKTSLFSLSPGQFVKAGEPLFNLLKIDQLDLMFQVPSKYLGNIQAGDSLWMQLPNSPPLLIFADRISPNLDSDFRNSMVKARIENPNLKLNPGSVVQVLLKPANPNSIWIPAQAVVPQLRGFTVAKIASGTVSFVPVSLGSRTDNSVEITSGLVPNDTLLTTGLLQLKPGDKVSVLFPSKTAPIP
ncbi:MAG: efflux RND transporter periplasmic adaptor subunit [Bacteroidia bacterium]